jgi:MYXO-CTERM domain-containing protein
MHRPSLFLLALAALGSTHDAAAYCRTTTCGSQDSADCAEATKCAGGGVPLYWPIPEVTIGVENGSVLRAIAVETARDVLTASMGAWTSVDCGGGQHPSISVAPIEITPIDPSAGSPIDRDATADSVSALRFFDDSWPHDGSAIALTTVRYGIESGKIVAADIEANSADNNLTVVDTGGEFDLQSVLTHESGHFFGLAHVVEMDATMYAAYTGGGNIDRRSLEQNDKEGICAVYPPGRFDQPQSGCGCRTVRASSGAGAWLFMAGLAFALVRRRHSATATPKNWRKAA